jgi:hypothetical protein
VLRLSLLRQKDNLNLVQFLGFTLKICLGYGVHFKEPSKSQPLKNFDYPNLNFMNKIRMDLELLEQFLFHCGNDIMSLLEKENSVRFI